MTRVAQRFAIIDELGRGGVGVVHSARDETTGEVVAIKRLLPHAANDPDARRRFEHEYKTLAGLKHPFIIDVYDYGLDEEGRPYFTMEYLRGNDLRSLPPTSVPQLCRYIRDVASSLALLHARRLLHRDLSPRNVRAAADGRAKLIDFGALVPFGLPREIIGTPPCVPPEALAGTMLDQRADLFALGAMAYYVLTGRHAYPARRLSELPLAWRQAPLGPRTHREDIPEELDALVMALLSPDAMARPATAAEVIDRLNAIAQLEPEQLDLKNAYLASPVLAGRREQIKQLGVHLSRARKGRGASVLVRGAPGSGKTRVLDELALSAQVGGALVLSVRGGAHRSAYSAVRALARVALDRAPTEATAAAESCRRALGHVVPELAFGAGPADLPQDPQERRAQSQADVQDWFVKLAGRVELLVIVVDDLGDVDEASAAALVALSFDAPRKPLIVAGSTTHEPRDASGPLMRAFAENSQLLELLPLSREHTLEIARSLFGDVAHLGRVAKWVFDRSEGYPQGILDVFQDLVRRDTIRYVDGTWVLPQELPAERAVFGESRRVQSRLDHLDDAARELLRRLSIHAGPLSLSECALLNGSANERKLYDSLDVLVSEGLLAVTAEGCYGFAQESLRQRLHSELSDDDQRQLHLRLGLHWANSRSGEDLVRALDAGWHLIHGGESTQGAELLAEAGQHLVEGAVLLAEAAPALEAALRVYRSQKRSKKDQLGLLVPLTIAGYMVDRKYADRYGEETFDLLVELTGLASARRMGRMLGGRGGLVAGTLAAAGKLALRRGSHGSDLKRYYVHLVIVSIVLVGVAGLTLDEPRVRRIVESLEPLANVPDDEVGALLYSYCHLIHLTQLGKEFDCLKLGYELEAKLDDKARYRELKDETRASWRGGLLYGIATYACYRNDDSGLRLAEKLEATGLAMHRMFASQVRMLYHAYRGEMSEARVHREQVERHAVEGGTTWQAELILPVVLIVPMALTGDSVGLKRCVEELETLSRDAPTLRLYHDLAVAHLKHQHGHAAEAARLFEAVTERMPVGRATAWQAARALLAEAYLDSGRAEDAQRTIDEARAYARPEDRPFAILVVSVELAHARILTARGELGKAAQLLEDLLAEYGEGTNPLILGLLNAERARVAARSEDAEGFAQYFEQAQKRLRATKNPVLIVKCERLARAGAEALGEGVASVDEELGRVMSVVREAMSECSTTQARGQKALALLTAETGATRAAMYVLAGEGVRLVAAVNTRGASRDEELQIESLFRNYEALVRAMTSHAREAEHSETESLLAPSISKEPEPAYCRFVLLTSTGLRPEAVAAVVLWGDGEQPERPDPRLLEALANSLGRGADDGLRSRSEETPEAGPV